MRDVFSEGWGRAALLVPDELGQEMGNERAVIKQEARSLALIFLFRVQWGPKIGLDTGFDRFSSQMRLIVASSFSPCLVVAIVVVGPFSASLVGEDEEELCKSTSLLSGIHPRWILHDDAKVWSTTPGESSG